VAIERGDPSQREARLKHDSAPLSDNQLQGEASEQQVQEAHVLAMRVWDQCLHVE
jgi:hypothetical protein